jgi:hypothetical protein
LNWRTALLEINPIVEELQRLILKHKGEESIEADIPIADKVITLRINFIEPYLGTKTHLVEEPIEIHNVQFIYKDGPYPEYVFHTLLQRYFPHCVMRDAAGISLSIEDTSTMDEFYEFLENPPGYKRSESKRIALDRSLNLARDLSEIPMEKLAWADESVVVNNIYEGIYSRLKEMIASNISISPTVYFNEMGKLGDEDDTLALREPGYRFQWLITKTSNKDRIFVSLKIWRNGIVMEDLLININADGSITPSQEKYIKQVIYQVVTHTDFPKNNMQAGLKLSWKEEGDWIYLDSDGYNIRGSKKDIIKYWIQKSQDFEEKEMLDMSFGWLVTQKQNEDGVIFDISPYGWEVIAPGSVNLTPEYVNVNFKEAIEKSKEYYRQNAETIEEPHDFFE